MYRRLLILLLCSFCVIVGSAAGAATTVHVQSGSALAAAISDPAVGKIVVDGPIRLELEHFSSDNVPIRLTRNLTITADAAGPHQVIDFNAREVRNKISIGTGYNLSLVHLTLKETRYGPGADVDILASSPGGILYLTDTAKLQMSCGALVKKQILAYVRDYEVPGVNDIGFPPTKVWDNVTYTDPIVYKDFSTRMGMGENVADRGYIVHKRYSWKLCAKIADPACVAAADIPTCVKQDQDAYSLAAHPHQPDSPDGLSPGAKAGVGVAAAVVGSLLLLASAVCVVRKARAAKALQQPPLLLPTTDSKLMPQGSSDSFEKSGGKYGGKPSPPHSLNSTPASRGCGDSLDSLVRSGLIKPAPGAAAVKPRPAGMPSILRGTLTEDQAADVQLGMLVGAGSYGRVFAGKLGTQDVAIKVLHHDDATAQEVASEVAMMMRFKHTNLVKAYHYITWGTADLSNRLTCPDDRERDDSSRLRSGLITNVGSGSGADSGTITSSDIVQRRPNRMLETWIICELCNAGNLQDAVLLHDHSVFFEGDIPQMGIILQTLLGVAKGMACLHASNVLHGDLKAANVLLCVSDTAVGSKDLQGDQGSQQEVELEPKVSDFGLSRTMAEGKTHHSTHTMGTITHQAPELMKSGRLSRAADVFSFGVIMWEMFHAAHPWKGLIMGEVMTAVMVEGRRLIWGTGVPKAYAALAEQCWQTESDARPSFARLVCTLQDLLQKHEALQAEVDKSCRRIGTWE